MSWYLSGAPLPLIFSTSIISGIYFFGECAKNSIFRLLKARPDMVLAPGEENEGYCVNFIIGLAFFKKP
jgi:hypothetical protein